MSDKNLPRELTEMQGAFVVAYVANGGNGTQAAIEAGYSEQSARQQAFALTHNPRVVAAIQTEQRRTFARIANKAIVVLEGFLDDKTAPAGVRLDAARTVLDRAGLTAKAAEADEAPKKPMSEWTIEELEAFIERQEPRGGAPPEPATA